MKTLLFTYVLTYGGALLGLIRPYHGFLAYVALAILRPHHLWHWSVPPGPYAQTVALAVLAGWALRGFGLRGLDRAASPVLLLGGFLAWSTLAALFAVEAAPAWKWVEALAKIVILFVVAATTTEDPRRCAYELAWVMVVCQGYVAFDLNLLYLEGRNVIEAGAYMGLGDRASFATGLLTCLGPGLVLALRSPGWKGLLAIFLSGCMIHAIIISYSRGAYLGILVLGAVALATVAKTRRVWALIGVGTLILLALVGARGQERFASIFADEATRDDSASGRLEMWGDLAPRSSRTPSWGSGRGTGPS